MPCDTKTRPGQTLAQRKESVRATVERLARGLASGKVGVKVGPQGAVAFTGLSMEERDGVTDACAYRRIMSTGSTMAKLAIARAEQLAGRAVDKKVITAGTHSHDGGHTWHSKG